jgi:type III secretion protein L
MLCLTRQGATIHPQGPVLKSADFAAAVAAGDLLRKAEEEAARIRAEAEETYLQRREQGHREGIEQGKAEMSAQVVATLGQSNEYLARIERALVDVVVRSTARVIGEFDQRERIERIVRQALDQIGQSHLVQLKVPPEQGEWMRSRVESLLTAFPRVKFLEVRTDSRIPADGCVLETEFAVIDATVETQLRAIEKALIQAIK